MIFILNSNETVVGTLARKGTTNKVTPYFDDKHVEDLSTGAETFTFSTFANTRQALNISIGNYIAFPIKNGYKLFEIMEVTEEHTEEHIKTAYCEMAGIELINEIVRPVNIPSANLKQFARHILQDTEFEVGIIDDSLVEVHTIEIKENKKVYNLIQEYIIGKFGAEVSFRVEIEGGRIVGKYLDCFAERGEFKGLRFEYGKNVSKVKKQEDSTELVTALIGEGKNGTKFTNEVAEDKPKGQDWIGNEQSYQMYNKKGSHIFDVFKFDTESPAELLRETRKELERRCVPKLKYEVSIETLGRDLNIGDTIYIIDNDYYPPLHLSARVSKKETHRTDRNKDKVTLANYKEVVSRITDEDRNIASIIDERFPIKEGDISNGAVSSDKIKNDAIKENHIVRDSITTEHLKANSITSDKIEAGQIKAEHILADQIKTEHLKTDSIDAKKIQANAIETKHLKADQIEAQHIKADAIETDHIKAGQVVSDHILADQIKTEHLQANAITTDKILAGAITTDRLEANSVTADKILAGSVSTNHLQADSITTDKILSGAITTDKLSANSINADKIVANSILSSHVKADQIEATHIKTGAITTDKILAGSVTSDKIGANQITTNHLKSGSVTADKVTTGELITNSAQIKTGIIGSAHIGNGQITNAHIGKGAIGEASILDGAITSAKITSASISNAHIKDATIEHGKIKSIDASKINTGTLDASKINVTNLKADSITAGSITVEGSNLIHGSDFKDLSKWVRSAGWNLDTTNLFEGAYSMKFDRNDVTSDTWAKLASEKVPCSLGDTFVLSGYFYKDNTSTTNSVTLNADILDADGNRIEYPSTSINLMAGSWVRGICVVKIDNPKATHLQLRTHVTRNGLYWVAKPMVSKGSLASIWKLHNDELISDGAITTDKIGDNAVNTSKLNLEELFVSEGAFINELQTVDLYASQLIVDEIRNDLINLSGLITFDSLNPELNDLLFIKDSNKTYINGNTILTNTIKASQIDLYNGLNVKKDGLDTFAVSTDGSVKVSGTIESFGFSNEEGQERGYRLTPEGDAYLNDAIVRGSVILPSAGVTNYGGGSSENILRNSSFNNGLNHWSTHDMSNGTGTTKSISTITNNAWSPKDCNVLQIRGTNVTGRYGVRSSGLVLKPNTKYTISGYCAGHRVGGLQVNIRDVANNDANIHTKEYAPAGGGSTFDKWYRFETTFTTTANTNFVVNLYGVNLQNDGYAWFGNIMLEEGEVASKMWQPNTLDGVDSVRFWAGASYEDRNKAPFRVYESGKIVSTVGEFGGTFTGSLDIGNIHITDTNTTNAEFLINSNNDAEQKVRLTDSSAEFDVDFRIGSVFSANVHTKEVDFGKGVSIELTNGTNTVVYGKNDSTTYDVYNIRTNSGGSHKLMSKNGYGGLSFTASGTQVTAGSETPYDYKFARASANEDVNVVIKGNLVVDNKITMADDNKIELVSVSGANSGIDFMIR